MALLAAFLSSAAAFASTALLIHWLMSRAMVTYAEGQERIGHYNVDRSGAGETGSLSAIAARLGLVFLPLNERLRDANTLGVGQMLANWEYRLIRAGLRSRMTAEQFLGVCEVGAVCGGLLVWLLSQAFGMSVLGGLLLGFPIGAMVGFGIPVMGLSSAADDRVALIEKRLPFAIEFMLLAMEANAALPQAMMVYRDLMAGDPLGAEFDAVLTDIDRGLSQIDALKAMGQRLDSDAMTAFLLAVTIGLDTGQPVKEVLQTQADATRRQRFQSAEEVAKTAGTRAIFPLFVVVLGILMLVLGPMAIKIVQGDLL